MQYTAKHSKETDMENARNDFYADFDIWDHEYDDPNEVQDEEDE